MLYHGAIGVMRLILLLDLAEGCSPVRMKDVFQMTIKFTSNFGVVCWIDIST